VINRVNPHLVDLTTVARSKAASMNKSKQKLVGLGILLLMLAGYTLLPPELQQLIQLQPDAATTSQNSSDGQRLNGQEGKSQQLDINSKQQGAAKSAQTEPTVRSPTNADIENTAGSRASKEFGQNTPAMDDDSRQKIGSSQRSPTAASKNSSSSDQPRGPPSNQGQRSQSSDDNRQSPDQTGTLVHGLLQEISKDQYLSPAGLIYGPGSAEGHRLDHLRRHVQNQPKRPGKHGVFDGGMQGALKTIDDAFRRAQKEQRTTKTIDRNRTIYTVDLGKRIGFVGGQDGGRRRNPMARRVRLVLEGKRVITAYPM